MCINARIQGIVQEWPCSSVLCFALRRTLREFSLPELSCDFALLEGLSSFHARKCNEFKSWDPLLARTTMMSSFLLKRTCATHNTFAQSPNDSLNRLLKLHPPVDSLYLLGSCGIRVWDSCGEACRKPMHFPKDLLRPTGGLGSSFVGSMDTLQEKGQDILDILEQGQTL